MKKIRNYTHVVSILIGVLILALSAFPALRTVFANLPAGNEGGGFPSGTENVTPPAGNSGGNLPAGNAGGNLPAGNSGSGVPAGNEGGGVPGGNETGGSGTAGNYTGQFSIQFKNPLKVNSIMCLIYLVFRILVNILAVVIGIYILFAGYRFIAAQGRPEKLNDARRNFYHVVIGASLILGAYAIVSIFINTINQFTTEPIFNLPTKTSCTK